MQEYDHPVSFDEWLKLRRKALDLTQQELALNVGCSVHALRKIESGERRPSKQLAGLLAKSLKIPPDEEATFIRVARGELNLERLGLPARHSVGNDTPEHIPVSAAGILPVQPTPLVGRETELAALKRLLSDDQCRLVTLIGIGGIGKTRLAIEIASRLQSQFHDGVYFVSLAALKSADYLVPAIADGLGLSFQGQVEPHTQLISGLHSKKLLLVLDGVEYVLDGVGLFTELLEVAPELKLLVTSQERLNLHGEWVFEIQGLPVPSSERTGYAAEYSSVSLFLQNARRVKAGFELGEEELPAVVRICRSMDGLPLGIELAAAWVSVLSCREIAEEIERSLDFLTTAMRDFPERQRSLRAAFDHSWLLLSENERRILSRLAIFQGGFTREAAEQVTRANLAQLYTLVSKSLVRHSESGRYDLHGVVRQFAFSHLSEDPQNDSVSDRFSEYYLVLLRDREVDLKGKAQLVALRELMGEIDNVRVAWGWAVMGEKYLTIGPALRSYALLCDMGGWLRQGIEQIGLVVKALENDVLDEQLHKVLGQALAQQGHLYFRLGEYDQALALFEKSLLILRPVGENGLLTDPLIFSGIIMHLRGEIEQSQCLLEEGLAHARATGDQWIAVYAIYNLGYVDSLLGHYEAGYQQMLSGLEQWRALGDNRYTALGLNFISPTAIYLGYFSEAQAFLEESIDLCTEVGDRWGLGTAYSMQGLLALTQGDPEEAERLIQKSLDIYSGFITGWSNVQSLVYLGDASAARGDFTKTRRIYLDSFSQALEIHANSLALDALLGLAELQFKQDEPERALRKALFVLNHTASTQDARSRAGLLADRAEAQLSSRQIQAAHIWTHGQSLDLIFRKLKPGG